MMLIRLFVQTVLLALSQIWANKVRSLLTTLGIMIGVAAVVATVAAVTGLKQFVLNEFEGLGAKKVWIWGQMPESMRYRMSYRDIFLTEEELNLIVDKCDSISKITPHWFGGYEVRNGTVVKPGVSVIGVWPVWHEIEGRTVTMGRPLSPTDEKEALNVCLINDKAIEELQLDTEPVGDDVLIGGRKFKIIGVLETKDLGALFTGGRDVQTEVFIPFSTAKILRPESAGGRIGYAMAEMTDPDQADNVKEDIRFVLRKSRSLKPDQEDTFGVEVLQQIIDQFNAMAVGITAVAGGIVAISLLVGGIGIMNIMLVSVSERTREIGLRKAVGAKSSVVLLQFLVEAVVLCVVGAGVGLVFGEALVLAMQHIPNFPLDEARIPAWAIALSAGFSILIGIKFGMFPALKAARLNPIDALRHE